MKLPFVRRRQRVSRGQAMVEFALILPVLVLLLLLAVDFGRVFFGWVGITNASRIAANEAAFHPEAWEGSGSALLKGIYRNQVLLDLQSINCEPAGGGAWATADIPDPDYIDQPGVTPTSNEYELGDHVRVTLTCHFEFVTPLVGLIVGNPMPISAATEFAIKGGEVNGIPIENGPPGGCLDKTVPQMVGSSVATARNAWSAAGFTGSFNPATGQDTETVTAQNTTPASVAGGCLVATATVTVTTGGPPSCTSPDITVPQMVNSTVSAARTTWYGLGFNNNTFTPNSGSDTDNVDSQTVAAGTCVPKNTNVTVTHTAPPPPPPGNCVMPQLIGQVKANKAEETFHSPAHGFTGPVTVTRPPDNNYDVTTQSLVAGQSYPCNSSLTVGGLAP